MLLTDEGVGVHIAQELQQRGLHTTVEVVDGGTGGFELIEQVRRKTNVIIVDCLTANAPPGSIIRLALDEIDLQRALPFSAHQGGVHELLTHVKTVSPKPEVVVIGIVPAILDQVGLNLSPAVEAQRLRIVSAVIDEIDDIMNHLPSSSTASQLREQKGLPE